MAPVLEQRPDAHLLPEVEDDGICLLVGSGSYTINAYKVFTAPQQTIFRRMTETLKNIPEFLKNF